MPVICPTVTASSEEDYKTQIENIVHFAHRIHVDLSDGLFAPKKLVNPDKAWWPVGVEANFHLMFKHPEKAVQPVLEHRPNLIIVHAEAEGDFGSFAKLCRGRQVSVGVALLPETPAETILPALEQIDHVLIFSGNLGYQGGSHVDFKLLNKSSILKKHKPELEIGWDGGINDQSLSRLIESGIDVLNVGGYIQSSPDPARAFNTLQRIADETGTT